MPFLLGFYLCFEFLLQASGLFRAYIAFVQAFSSKYRGVETIVWLFRGVLELFLSSKALTDSPRSESMGVAPR